MEFQGKVAMITGASVGIGRAVALLLAQQGADLVLLDINMEKLEAVRADAEKAGSRVKAYKCDVSDENRVNEITADATEYFGKIDILVNNAALWRDRSAFEQSSSDSALWDVRELHVKMQSLYAFWQVIVLLTYRVRIYR